MCTSHPASRLRRCLCFSPSLVASNLFDRFRTAGRVDGQEGSKRASRSVSKRRCHIPDALITFVLFLPEGPMDGQASSVASARQSWTRRTGPSSKVEQAIPTLSALCASSASTSKPAILLAHRSPSGSPAVDRTSSRRKLVHCGTPTPERHPESAPIALLFRPPMCTRDHPSTFQAVVRGLVHGVCYLVVLEVKSGAVVIFDDEWTLEKNVFNCTIPALSAAPHTIRVSIFDAIGGLSGEENLLSTMIRPVDVCSQTENHEYEVLHRDSSEHSSDTKTQQVRAADPAERTGALQLGPSRGGDEKEAQPEEVQQLAEDFHGVNHPAVGIVVLKLVFHADDGGMLLHTLFYGLVPGFDYKLEVVELSRVGLDLRSVYVKQKQDVYFSCPGQRCNTTVDLRILEHFLPEFTEDETVFRFDIVLKDLHDGLSEEDAVVCRKSKFMHLTLPDSMHQQVSKVGFLEEGNSEPEKGSTTEDPDEGNRRHPLRDLPLQRVRLTQTGLLITVQTAVPRLRHLVQIRAQTPYCRFFVGSKVFIPAQTNSSGWPHDLVFALTAGEWKIIAAGGQRRPRGDKGPFGCSHPDVLFDVAIFLLLSNASDYRFPIFHSSVRIVESLFERHCIPNVDAGAATVWQADDARWRTWLQSAYLSGAKAALLANVPHAQRFLASNRSSHATNDDGSPNSTKRRGIDESGHKEDGVGQGWRMGGAVKGDMGRGAVDKQCDARIWHTPVVVMNRPHDVDRRENSARLMRDVGFVNVSFPPTMAWTHLEASWEGMVERGLLSPSLWSRLQAVSDTTDDGFFKYAANALSQIQSIQIAADAGEPLVLIEDDLMLGGELTTIRNQICQAMSNVPPDADMVYMEFCLESCTKLSYNVGFSGIAKSSNPSCAAAVFFTAKGTRAVCDLSFPIFDVVDRMYPSLIASGNLKAYSLVPAPFYQDQKFQSNWYRGGHHSTVSENIHGPAQASVPCREAERSYGNEFDSLAPIDRRQVGIRFSASRLEDALDGLETESCLQQHQTAGNDHFVRVVWMPFSTSFLLDSDLLSHGFKITYQTLCRELHWTSFTNRSTPDFSSTRVTVGTSFTLSSCGILLRIGNSSECWDLPDGGLCELYVSMVSDSHMEEQVLKTIRYSLFIIDGS